LKIVEIFENMEYPISYLDNRKKHPLPDAFSQHDCVWIYAISATLNTIITICIKFKNMRLDLQ